MDMRDNSSQLVSDPNQMTSQRTSKYEDHNNVRREADTPTSEQTEGIDRGLVAAMVGHELREPLNAIISFLNVTIQERLGPLNELQSEFLRSTESAARRLERRINDVQIALLHGDALRLQRSWINPNARVIAICRELEWAAERYDITVLMGMEQSTRNPGVWADPDRLDQVLINLVENGIRYASAGSEVRVSTSFREQGFWTFLVENEVEGGAGYDPSKWFQPGERSRWRNDQSRPGLGLGLTIARHLVHAHGGEIWADVVDDRVQFGFSIPHHQRAKNTKDAATD
jgi:signal transduction histidine kinase